MMHSMYITLKNHYHEMIGFHEKLPARCRSGLSPVYRFYQHDRPTPAGDMIQSLWNRGQWWYRGGFEDLEQKHDYIQWLFPTSSHSRFNRDAPIVTREEVLSFSKMNPEKMTEMQTGMRKSLQLMLSFYGLEFDKRDNTVIKRACNFSPRSLVWLTPDNHNFLRLTRILSSLDLFGLSQEKQALFTALKEIKESEGQGIITEKTFSFWQEAATQTPSGLFNTLYRLIRPAT